MVQTRPATITRPFLLLAEPSRRPFNLCPFLFLFLFLFLLHSLALYLYKRTELPISLHHQKPTKMKVSSIDDSQFFRKGVGTASTTTTTYLTVMKTSLFFAGDGFTVYDCNGKLVFRVDSYGPDSRYKDELVLMDPHGRCLFTVRRKRPSLHQRWEGYLQERINGQKPIFGVRRSSVIGRSSLTVEMYRNSGEEYQIEGSFGQRLCKVLNAKKEIVAEIKRKVDASTNVLLGKDVFSLSVKPGFNGAFAMALVLVLDRINGDNGVNSGGESNRTLN